MVSICRNKLPIDRIIDHWLEEEEQKKKQPPARWEELHDFFEAAWWRDDWKADCCTRLALLEAMYRSARAGHSTGIVFLTPEEAKGIEQPGGSLLFKFNLGLPRILIPSDDPETWSDASCATAFQALSEIPSRKHYRERTVGISLMEIDYNQFVWLLTAYGFDLPTFWRPPIQIRSKQEAHTSAGGEAYREQAHTVGSDVRKRGPKPAKLNRVKEEMRRYIEEGHIANLRDTSEKQLACNYGVSRDTARKARNAVLSEFVEN